MNLKNNHGQTLIIIISDEPWCDVWHTQLHYAWQLSERCMVYYVSPPAKWKFSNLFTWKIPVKKERENLFVMTYHNVLPVSFMNDFFVMINDIINSFLIKRKIPEEKTKIIFWRFTYYRFLHTYFIKAMRSVYHVVDHYMGSKNDRRLAKKSDLVISTSPKFMDYYRQFNKNVINVPQAVSSEEFICDDSIVSRLKNDYGKIILFIGTLSWETNLDIPEQLSEKFPGCTLLIIGPNMLADETEKRRFEELVNKKNVKYAGTIPALKLKNFVKAAEVCIISYKFSHEKKMNVRSPLKAISYIAQKKIVISSIDCEIKELENKIIYNAANLEEFLSLMQKAIDKKLFVDEKAVDEFLKRISYDNLIDFIFSQF